MKRRSLILAAAIVTIISCLLGACADKQNGKSTVSGSPDASLAFDAAEAEFIALTPLLSMAVEDNAKVIIRERLVVCVMIMQNCAERGVSVTRELPNDGFEEQTVTVEWIQPYVDQASRYPEWNDRNALVIGVLIKISG